MNWKPTCARGEAKFVSTFKLINRRPFNLANYPPQPARSAYRLCRNLTPRSRTSQKSASINQRTELVTPNQRSSQLAAFKVITKYKLRRSSISQYKKSCKISKSPYVPKQRISRFTIDRRIAPQKQNSFISAYPKTSWRRWNGHSQARKCVRKSIYRLLYGRNKTVRSRSKINRICLNFVNYGKCRRGSDCKLRHDPDKVSICPLFLKLGKCDRASCLLCHEYCPDKMPICQFFLNGVCSRVGCTYLHIKFKPDATVCRHFKQGYCPSGVKCDKMHLVRTKDDGEHNKSRWRSKRTIVKTPTFKFKRPMRSNAQIGSDASESPSFIRLPSNSTDFDKFDQIRESLSRSLANASIIPSFLHL